MDNRESVPSSPDGGVIRAIHRRLNSRLRASVTVCIAEALSESLGCPEQVVPAPTALGEPVDFLFLIPTMPFTRMGPQPLLIQIAAASS